MAAPQRGAELQLQAQPGGGASRTRQAHRGQKLPFFPKLPQSWKKNQSSDLRGTLPTSRESVVNSGTGLVLAHLDHKVERAASPEAVFSQKRVIYLDDFYQRAQVVFNLQLPRAAIREGKGRMGRERPELLARVLRRGGFLHPSLPLSRSQFQLNSKESQRCKFQK